MVVLEWTVWAMKKTLAGAFVLAIIYLAWPYYTLIEISRTVESGDTATLTRLADWDKVRASVKTQVRAHFEQIRKKRPDPAFAGAAGVSTDAVIEQVIDKFISPEGLAGLGQYIRAYQLPPAASSVRVQLVLSSYVKFAFFVSPIHFRVDLRESNDSDRVAARLMLMFKGSGWQVIGVDVPDFDLPS